jgi:hypothetical protein
VVKGRVAARAATVCFVVPVALGAMSGAAFGKPHRHHHVRAARPRPAVSIADASIVEPAKGTKADLTLTVTLSAAPRHPSWVVVWTRNGTARHQDRDYDPVVRFVRFDRNGPLSKTVAVPVRGDSVVEGPETFSVFAAYERHVAVATGTILPVAPPPPPPPPSVETLALNVTGSSVLEPAFGGLSDGSVMVALAAPADHDVTLTYTLVGVTASQGSDFLAQSGTLVFPAGSTDAQEIVVTVVGDDVIEPDETFEVRFSVPGGGVVPSPSAATVTIVDDDADGAGPVFDPL